MLTPQMVPDSSTNQIEQSTGIEWKEPPPAQAGKPGEGRWQKVARELQQHPGRWALVGTDVSPGIADRLKSLGMETTLRGFSSNAKGYRRAAEMYARWPEGGSDE